MGKYLQIDTAITDLDAPFLPHSAGAAGYRHRYAAAYVPEAAGSKLARWDDLVGSAHLTLVGVSQVTRKREGVDYAEFAAMAAGSRLNNTAPGLTAPFTYSAVIRLPINSGIALRVNGLGVTRAATGVYSLRANQEGESKFSSVNSSEWVHIVATHSAAAASALYIDGALAIPEATWTAPPAQQNIIFGTANGDIIVDIAEVIVWPRKLSSAEVSAVRGAMKGRYPLLG